MSKGAISKCTATTRTTGAGRGGLGGGGGLFISGGSVTLTLVSMSRNKSLSNGGGIYNSSGRLTLNSCTAVTNNNAARQGGGLYLATSSITTFHVVTVKGNVANGFANGNGVYVQGVNGQGARVTYTNGMRQTMCLLLLTMTIQGEYLLGVRNIT